MKQITILSIFLTLCYSAYSQDTTISVRAKLFLTNQSITLSPSEIITNFRQTESSWIDKYSMDEPALFESAFNLNVFNYYKLNDTYDSELKREVYKQTAEYKALLDSLKKIKSDYLSSTYYEFGFNKIGEQHFTDAGEVDYNLEKKGFFIGIGEVLPYQCDKAFCPKVIEDVEFPQLVIQKKYNLKLNSDHSYTQYLFIPLDATNALEMENNRSQIVFLRVFTVKTIYTATLADNDFIKDNHGDICKIKVVKGGNMRLVVFNNTTGKIYFDKLYSQIQTK